MLLVKGNSITRRVLSFKKILYIFEWYESTGIIPQYDEMNQMNEMKEMKEMKNFAVICI